MHIFLLLKDANKKLSTITKNKSTFLARFSQLAFTIELIKFNSQINQDLTNMAQLKYPIMINFCLDVANR